MTDKELAECRLDEIGTQNEIGLYWKARCEAAELAMKKMRLDYWDRLSFISAYFDPETVRQELIRFCRTEFAQEIEDSAEDSGR